MTTALFTHPVCVEHDPGPGHPERPARLEAVLAALDGDAFAALDRRQSPLAGMATIELMHDADYVATIFDAVPDDGYRSLDPDTSLSPQSGEAAKRSAGGVVAAVDAVAAGTGAGGADNAFCAGRPPGHHAERDRAMGFCLFNNIAIGAAHARAAHGLERVAVLDFDVHHGNGTQSMFWSDADYLYASTHQFPAYPGTGAADETGAGNLANIINAPLAPGTGSMEFRAAVNDVIVPALRQFQPDLLMISAGFDAHQRDPLCQLNLTTEDFAWVSRQLKSVAEDCCAGRLVSVLEGGYDLDALAECAAAHIQVLMDL